MRLEVQEYADRVRRLVPAPSEVRLPIDECRGLVLARDVIAKLPVPPFTNSAMDGFAVRAAEVNNGVTLPVAFDVPAGDTTIRELPAGSVARIMTGAAMPAGADTVVKVENTDHAAGVSELPETVTIHEAPKDGANVRHVGEAIGEGALVLEAGCVLTSARLSAAVSVGYAELLVYRRPRAGVITTGTELAKPGESLGHGQIPNSNDILLRALLQEAGADVVACAIVADEPEALRRELETWPEVDVVMSSGGISAGAYEVVRQTFGESNFTAVAQQPGGPQGCGRVTVAGKDTMFLAFPGNPVAVFVSFHVYGLPALHVIEGSSSEYIPNDLASPCAFEAVAATGWSSPAKKTQFIPLHRVAAGKYTPVHKLGSGSHLITSLAHADGLGVIPASTTEVHEGDAITVLPIISSY